MQTLTGVDAPTPLAVSHRFPALREERGYGIRVFADNSSRAQMPDVTLQAITQQLLEQETHRGGNTDWDSQRAADMAGLRQRARQVAAGLCGGTAAQIGFAANGTSALAILAKAMFGTVVKPGDRIVVTEADHDANRTPWLWLERQGCKVIDVPVAADGALDMDAWEQALSSRPALVALCMISNVTGTVLPFVSLAQQAREAGAVVVLDAVQGPPHGYIDIMQPNVDVAVFSNCKLFSPHLGWWASQEALLDRMGLTPASGHHPELEWGTFAHAGFAGFVATHGFLAGLEPAGDLRKSMQAIRRHERTLTTHFLDGLPLALRPHVLAGHTQHPRVPIFSIPVRRTHWAAVRSTFEQARIDARIGQFGCPATLRRLAPHTDGVALRLSFVHYNSTADVDAVCSVLHQLVPLLA